MALAPETKEKLKKALPWIIGGAVVLFVVVKLAGSKRGGSAPVQDLSGLGGGGGGGLVQQPPADPQQIAQQFADQLAGRQQAVGNLRAWWADQSGQRAGGPANPPSPYTGVVSKAWKQISAGGWEDIYHPGHVITEEQAQALSSQDSGPYARGGGGFFGQVGNFLGGILKIGLGGAVADRALGAPVTLGNAYLGPRTPRQVPTPSGGVRPQPGGTGPGSANYSYPYTAGIG